MPAAGGTGALPGAASADGAPDSVMQPDTIAQVFDVRSQLHRLENDRPWITYGY